MQRISLICSFPSFLTFTLQSKFANKTTAIILSSASDWFWSCRSFRKFIRQLKSSLFKRWEVRTHDTPSFIRWKWRRSDFNAIKNKDINYIRKILLPWCVLQTASAVCIVHTKNTALLSFLHTICIVCDHKWALVGLGGRHDHDVCANKL